MQFAHVVGILITQKYSHERWLIFGRGDKTLVLGTEPDQNTTVKNAWLHFLGQWCLKSADLFWKR